MKLLATWNDLTEGKINAEQAAEALGVTVETIKARLREPKEDTLRLLNVLDLIAADKVDRDTAAEMLDVSPRAVNLHMRKWKISRPVKAYVVERAYAETKWEVRKKFATDFIGLRIGNFEEAAEAAGISTRQIRRWVSEMLLKHFNMQYKDLLPLGVGVRQEMAQKILDAENLEDSKQRLAEDIAFGRRKLEDEAKKRAVAAKKAHTVKKNYGHPKLK